MGCKQTKVRPQTDEALLKTLQVEGLEEFADSLADLGVRTVAHLADIEDDDLKDLRMSRIQRTRMRRLVEREKASSSASSTPDTSAGAERDDDAEDEGGGNTCLLYTSPSPRDRTRSRMPSSA